MPRKHKVDNATILDSQNSEIQNTLSNYISHITEINSAQGERFTELFNNLNDKIIDMECAYIMREEDHQSELSLIKKELESFANIMQKYYSKDDNSISSDSQISDLSNKLSNFISLSLRNAITINVKRSLIFKNL